MRFDDEKLKKHLKRIFLQLKTKIERSARELAKLNSKWRPTEQDPDHEMLTDEERECYRKMGLKLDSSLVLGKLDFHICICRQNIFSLFSKDGFKMAFQ